MKKPRESYNIIVIPERGQRTRRFRMSRRLLGITGAGIFGLGAIAACLGWLAWSYRQELLFSEASRSQAVHFQRERANLIARLGELEAAVGRADRFAAALLAQTERDKKRLRGGVGPLEKIGVQEIANLPSEAIAWRSPGSSATNEELKAKLDDLTAKATKVEDRIHEAFAFHKDRLYLWASLPTVWPARGWLTSVYGDKRRSHGMGNWHEGVDIASPHGAPIVASGSGYVTYVGYRGGYGKTVIIDHGFGITTLYGHCSQVFVTEGMHVPRGTTIGKVGSTGRSTGPHLHYEVRIDGVAVNPMKYILEQS